MKTCSKCAVSKPATPEHFSRRSGDTLRPECKACQSEYRRAYGARHREELNTKAAQYRSANGENLAHKERARRLARLPAERASRNRAYALAHEYGMSIEEYEDLLSRQDGRCALCRRPPSGKALCVDHDHETGRIRGLLCVRCNSALGTLGDDEEGVLRALSYLRGVL